MAFVVENNQVMAFVVLFASSVVRFGLVSYNKFVLFIGLKYGLVSTRPPPLDVAASGRDRAHAYNFVHDPFFPEAMTWKQTEGQVCVRYSDVVKVL